MASMTSCSTYKGCFSVKELNLHKHLITSSYLDHCVPIVSRSSGGLRCLRLLLTHDKSVKWGQPRKQPRNGTKSPALADGNVPSSTLEKRFQQDDVIDAQQFDRDTLSATFEVAREMEKIEKDSLGSPTLKGYLMATLFYEPSTRTRLSFESAMERLGGEVLTTENAHEFSSAAKGETLEGA